jgi:hypothetical protein
MGDDRHLHVLEDVVFVPRTIPFLDQVIGDAFGRGAMVFTDRNYFFVDKDNTVLDQLGRELAGPAKPGRRTGGSSARRSPSAPTPNGAFRGRRLQVVKA